MKIETFEQRCPCGSGVAYSECCDLLAPFPPPQQPLPADQAEPGLPALLGALSPADRVPEQCRHTCPCTSDMECPHDCTCQS